MSATRTAMGITLGMGLALGMASLARGACALTQISVDRAEVVFVGQLTFVEENGNATFDVEDVWRGADLTVGQSVLVEAPEGLLSMAPEGSGGFRYVVLAQAVAGQLQTGFIDCAIYPFSWDASYGAFRPADASPPPVAEGDEPAGVPGALIALVAAAGVLVIVAGIAFRSRVKA